MEVTLHNSCYAFLTQHHSPESFINEIRTQVLEAWEKWNKDENSTRVMVHIPSEHGQHYHFFTVSLYGTRKDLLSVKA
ncbi:hypothetical protein [Rodentibacter trehalosifermentans]|uniref:hypothetical protein n=1 Tax=Rodentibacter trehalosifermentans TaxID=1908263 RepID=UPI0009866312|nr:hypothetical protein [Rodentibacter trehalosifermentans]OOF52317.1 hypothetical protein BKK53_05995 [Rodentibacter trehalosifermentans]